MKISLIFFYCLFLASSVFGQKINQIFAPPLFSFEEVKVWERVQETKSFFFNPQVVSRSKKIFIVPVNEDIVFGLESEYLRSFGLQPLSDPVNFGFGAFNVLSNYNLVKDIKIAIPQGNKHKCLIAWVLKCSSCVNGQKIIVNTHDKKWSKNNNYFFLAEEIPDS